MLRKFLFIVTAIVAIMASLIGLKQIALPALVVFSLVPQIEKPFINYVTREPQIIAKSSNMDIYKPAGKIKGILVLFHAANEKGKDDERMQRLANVLARSGLKVYVPTLKNLNREKFHPDVITEMKEIIAQSLKDNPEKNFKILSFSIGVGPELIAAADQDTKEKIDLLIAFGGYIDLENIVRFHTTGQTSDPFGAWLLARYYAQFLPENDAQIFYDIAERKWQNPDADISDLSQSLGVSGKKALALVINTNSQAIPDLIQNLPQELKDFFIKLNPRPAIPNLQAPVLILHSRNDPIIPFEESEKLLAALSAENKDAQFIELKIFNHVNLELPSLNSQNLLKIYIPEFLNLYRAAWKIIY